MAGWFELNMIGAPAHGDHRHRRLRAWAALAAAFAGGLAVLVVGFIAVGGVGPSDGTWAWVALPVLAMIWVSGMWWRWDAVDRRKRSNERERRGF
jgi:hypothetical protein